MTERRCDDCLSYERLGTWSGRCIEGFAKGTIYPSDKLALNWAPKCDSFDSKYRGKPPQEVTDALGRRAIKK